MDDAIVVELADEPFNDIRLKEDDEPDVPCCCCVEEPPEPPKFNRFF